MKQIKRIIAMMLAVIMFVGLLPMNVFADDWTSLGLTLGGSDGDTGDDTGTEPVPDGTAPDPVSLTLNVKNTVVGSDRPASHLQTFTFTLSGEGITDTVSVTDAGVVAFNTLTFDAVGEYTYTVKETVPSPMPTGYTYDDTERTVIVTVTDDDGMLELTCTVNGRETDTATFVNTYIPLETTLTFPLITKAFTAESDPRSDTQKRDFTFILTDPDGVQSIVTVNDAGTVSLGDQVFDEAGSYQYTVIEEDNGVPGYTYDNAKYYINVDVTDNNGQLSASYTVTKDGAAASGVTFTNAFNNEISSNPGKLYIPFTKTWRGTPAESLTITLYKYTGTFDPATAAVIETKTLPNADGKWNYKFDISSEPLYDGSDNAYSFKVVETLPAAVADLYIEESHKDPEVKFTAPLIGQDGGEWIRHTSGDNLSISMTGSGHAVVIAKKGNTLLVWSATPLTDAERHLVFDSATTGVSGLSGLSYGNAHFFSGIGTPSGYGMTVYEDHIEFSKKSEFSIVAWGLYTQSSTTANEALITNAYIPGTATLNLPIEKEITGIPRPAGEEKDFTFTLTAVSPRRAPKPADTTLTITDEGNAVFGPILYYSAGTYTYQIKETAGSDTGYIYDTTPRTVVVTVTNNNDVMEVSWTVDGEAADSVMFSNHYGPKPTTLEIPVQKTVSGLVPEGSRQTFAFTLTPVTAGAPMPGSSTATVRGSGNTAFGEIKFTVAGEYTYTVTENIPVPAPIGYTYDDNEHTVVVNVVNDNGQLAATWTVDGETADAVAFTNTYTPSATKLIIPVTKTVSGPVPEGTDKTFEFTLSAVTADAPMPETAWVSITGSGSAEFGEMTFKDVGTYEYTVKETVPDPVPTGYTYDSAEREVTVTVINNRGNLEATWTVNGKTADAVAFTNTYAPVGISVIIPVTKTVSGDVPEGREKTFRFTLTGDGQSQTKSITGSGSVNFDAISYTETGTHTYTVKEKIPEPVPTGYTYDETEHTVVVTVADEGGALNATWKVDEKTADAVAFANTYEPQKTTFAIPLKKIVSGPVPTGADKTFTFELTGIDGAPMPASDTAEITGNGTSSFDTITFDKTGSYTYTVKETKSSETGYTYDETVHTVVVTVTDDNGTLQTSWTLDNGPVGAATRVTFTNTYKPVETTFAVPVQKTVTGPVPTGTDKTFTFLLTGKDGAPMPASDTAEITGSGDAAFGPIGYDKVGTYTYTVKETVPSPKPVGYTYDTATHTVTVTVTDNNGTLQTSWKLDNVVAGADTKVAFTNTYLPAATSIVIPVQKTVTGPVPAGTDKTFEFTLTGDGQTQTKSITGSGYASFDAIEYTAVGTHTYTVKETIPTTVPTGYTYDETAHTVVVTVTDDNGTLKATWTLDGNAATSTTKVAFTNTYLPAATSIVIPVQKAVTGPVPTGTDKTFEFTLTGDGQSQRKNITGNGSASFDAIEYTAVGTHTYTVKETIPDPVPAGYTYDNAVHTVTVTVTDNNGTLETSWKLDNVAAGSDTKVAFINTYLPAATSVVIPVQKTVTGPVPSGTDKTFEFTLTGDGQTQSKNITGNGSASFDAIEYTAVGTHTYTAKETKGSETGYTYDETVHTVVVTVTDDNGTLKATWTLDGSAAGADTKVAFTNTYLPVPTSITIPVEKTVTGPVPTGTDKTFEFTLTGDGQSQSKNITGSGSVSFDAIEYTAVGTYTYTVKETKGSETGYTYDETVHTVVVTVVDDNGTLKATWTLDGKAATSMTKVAFTNTYLPVATSLVIPIEKTVTGPVPEGADKTFTFTLTGDGQTQSKNITGSGSVSFDAIEYTAVGTHTYTVKETIPTTVPTGYTYDETAHAVVVTVVDDNGTLKATWTLDGKAATSTTKVAFTNTYLPVPTSIVIPVQKTVTGPVPTGTDKTFEFTLTGDGQTQTKNITGSGSVSFDTIEYTAVGTYTYTVKETKGSETGYTYDETAHTVVVTVVDDNGKLKTSWTLDGEATTTTTKVAFTNAYKPVETTFAIPVKKTVNGPVPSGADKTFVFALTGKNGAPMPQTDTTEITGNGETVFGDITFDKVGAYTYTVKEMLPDPVPAGYTYDKNVHTVVITVTDDNGTLKTSWQLDDSDASSSTSVAFINTYLPSETMIIIPVKKTVSGPVPTGTDKTFEFTIEALTSGAPMPASATVSVTGAGETAFEVINFKKVGTYQYTVKETIPTTIPTGYTYDETVHAIVVTVVDDNGTLKATWTLDATKAGVDTKVAFINTYLPVATSLVIPVKKTVTGPVPTGTDKTFEFTLTGDGQSQTKAIKGSGSASFDAIEYTAVGTHTYTVKETIPTTVPTGYTYDETVHTIVVTVVDDNGTLKATWTLNGSAAGADTKVAFTNTYLPVATSIVIPVQKTVTGPVPTGNDKTFEFTLTGDGQTQSKNITGSGSASFDAIEYTAVGTHTYTVKETIPTTVPTGYTYDEMVHTVVVTVTDDNGTLKATWTLDGNAATSTTKVAFTNTYLPVATSLTIPVQKTVTGPVPTGTDKTFEFTLTGDGQTQSKNITGSGSASFDAIEYTAVGTHTYTVKETKGSETGYTYDETAHTVVVTVADDNGTLKATWTLDGKAATSTTKVAFTNTYLPAATSVVIPVQKTVTGPVPEGTDKTFEFTLTGDGQSLSKNITGSGIASFDAIEYTAVGTYTYTVKETKGSETGYTYDETVHTVVVTVVDDNGVLKATWTLDGSAAGADTKVAFTNTYLPEPTSIVIPVQKTVTGPVPTGNDKTFEFTLIGDGQSQTKAIKGSGSTSFDAIEYTAVGTHTYTVKETKGSETGYTYDETAHTVVVTVVDDNGTLKTSWTLDGKAATSTTKAAFTNTYLPVPTSLVIPVKKTVTGPVPAGMDKTFEFTLSGDGQSQRKNITGNGSASFNAIDYTAVGTYTYTVKETKGSETGYTYDETVHTVIVTVTDDDGTLKTGWTLDGAAAGPDTMVAFENSYLPVAVTFEIPVKKTVTGPVPKGNEKTFTFVMTGKDGAPMPASASATITGSGDTRFKAISFTKTGVYGYTVKETKGSETGYTYDETAHTVVVTVVDDNGMLKTSWTLDGTAAAAGTKVSFANTYLPLPTSLAVPLQKTVNGIVPKGNDKTFDFTLRGDGQSQTKSVTGNGSVSFDAIEYTAVGTHKYTVKEIIPDTVPTGYTYDKTVHTVIVTVTDDNGTLKATWTLDGKATTSTTKVAFSNIYEPIPTTIALPVEKQIEGNGRPAAYVLNFRFILRGPNGEVLTRVIADTGTAEFDPLTFTKAGDYRYTVREQRREVVGYTFDKSVIEIIVRVTDNDGVLSATFFTDGVEGATSVFVNRFETVPIEDVIPALAGGLGLNEGYCCE